MTLLSSHRLFGSLHSRSDAVRVVILVRTC